MLFADFELRAHRLVEQDQPITAEILTEIYTQLLKDYYGDAVDLNPLTGITWARIPHFFNSPYYVYQYATCFASAARLAKEIMEGGEAERAAARDALPDLLRSGGNDYPMEQLKKAGVDLSKPDTVGAIVNQLDDLVTAGTELGSRELANRRTGERVDGRIGVVGSGSRHFVSFTGSRSAVRRSR